MAHEPHARASSHSEHACAAHAAGSSAATRTRHPNRAVRALESRRRGHMETRASVWRSTRACVEIARACVREHRGDLDGANGRRRKRAVDARARAITSHPSLVVGFSRPASAVDTSLSFSLSFSPSSKVTRFRARRARARASARVPSSRLARARRPRRPSVTTSHRRRHHRPHVHRLRSRSTLSRTHPRDDASPLHEHPSRPRAPARGASERRRRRLVRVPIALPRLPTLPQSHPHAAYLNILLYLVHALFLRYPHPLAVQRLVRALARRQRDVIPVPGTLGAPPLSRDVLDVRAEERTSHVVTRRVDGVELPVEVAHGDDVPPVDAQRRASVGRGEGVPGVDVEPTVSKRERGGPRGVGGHGDDEGGVGRCRRCERRGGGGREDACAVGDGDGC